MEETQEKVTPQQFLHEGVPLIGFDTARALWETGLQVTFVCTLSRTDRLIPGSEWIPAGKIEEEAARKLPDTDRIIITYCSNFECQASVKAAKALMKLGYRHVLDFKGGLAERDRQLDEICALVKPDQAMQGGCMGGGQAPEPCYGWR